MEITLKEVRFDLYCSKCKHKDVEEWEDPCLSCLCDPVAENSHKPVKFEEE